MAINSVLIRSFTSLDSCLANIIMALNQGDAVDVALGDPSPSIYAVKLIDSGIDATYKIQIIDDEAIVNTFNGYGNRLSAVRAFVARLKNGTNQQQRVAGDFVVLLNASEEIGIPPSGGNNGSSGATTAEIIAALKADNAFMNEVEGEVGQPGQDGEGQLTLVSSSPNSIIDLTTEIDLIFYDIIPE